MPTKNQIITELYLSKDFNECISKMHPDHLRDDLKSEVMVILLNLPDEKFKEIRNIKFYTVRIIMQLIQSSSSPFYKMYRRHNYAYFDSVRPDNFFTADESGPVLNAGKAVPGEHTPDMSERVMRELQEERVTSYIQNLYWYDREIIELYMKLGSYRAIEKETGIPWESCYSTIRKVIKQIRINVLMSQPV